MPKMEATVTLTLPPGSLFTVGKYITLDFGLFQDIVSVYDILSSNDQEGKPKTLRNGAKGRVLFLVNVPRGGPFRLMDGFQQIGFGSAELP